MSLVFTFIAYAVLVMMGLMILRWIFDSDWYFYLSKNAQFAVAFGGGIALGLFTLVYWILALIRA